MHHITTDLIVIAAPLLAMTSTVAIWRAGHRAGWADHDAYIAARLAEVQAHIAESR